MVHHAVSAERVVVTADRELRKLGSKPGAAFRITKEFLYRDTWRMMASSPGDDGVFLDCWFNAAAQRRIAEVAQSLGR